MAQVAAVFGYHQPQGVALAAAFAAVLFFGGDAWRFELAIPLHKACTGAIAECAIDDAVNGLGYGGEIGLADNLDSHQATEVIFTG